MKKALWVLGLGLVVLVAFTAAQNPVLDFKLVNKTGVDIKSVYISPADVNEWGDDIMEQDILEDGAEVDLEFHPEETATKWDLKVEDDEGDAIVWENLDLSKINVLTLKIVDGKPIAEIK
jgi:hypothetical protein